jgi:hypothetical protein
MKRLVGTDSKIDILINLSLTCVWVLCLFVCLFVCDVHGVVKMMENIGRKKVLMFTKSKKFTIKAVFALTNFLAS